ncbi:uncharacterized protein LOC123565854 [Mercenaria mercenaria]|uniref:uncharacterized protein LOC123565854 n=1 Tax=Mercenaria mercenaria TaxID=6596 RepID=UPI00234EF9B4|nr:uncharacterized protein LOC123565854 [Mercenaria mercenaria]
MPRVVQVPSSETEEVNVYNADSSESEDTVNRNFNQTVNSVSELVSSYMRFPINYSLYNVTYLDSESDPYCLRCVIDGQVKKFKKDARTWLHKSSDRKRKIGDEAIRSANIDENGTACKNLKMVSDATQLIACGGTYRSGPYNTDVNNDLLSEISSLGDSDADLTYSEESSPSLDSETRDKYQKSVRFDDTVNTGYRIHALSSGSDESLNAAGKTISSRNIVFQDESELIEDRHYIGSANASRNNIRPGPTPLEVSRKAPDVCFEIEPLQESFLDCTVNLSSKPQPDGLSSNVLPLAQDVKHNPVQKMKYKKRRQEKGKPYNLRSTKKVDLHSTDDGAGQVVPTVKQSRQWEDARYTIEDVRPAAASMNLVRSREDVRPAAASTDLAHTREVVKTDQMPSCSRDDENWPECSSVPKLFVLAGRVLYKHMKSELDKSI